MNARELARRLLPPVFIEAGVRLGVVRAEWEYSPNGWEVWDASGLGWNVDAVVQTETAKWPEFLRLCEGAGPLGIAHEALHPSRVDMAAHNEIMTYGYVLAGAGRMKESLSILDWGGGLGHFFVLSRALLPDLALRYVCKDLPLMCEAGRRLLPEVTFCDDEVQLEGQSFDLVHAGTSLQYSRDWRGTLKRLSDLASEVLYVARLPVVERSEEFMVLQHAQRYGYGTTYPCWYLSRHAFLQHAASCGLSLEREFLMSDHPYVRGAPEQGEYRGFLFGRTSS